ncbi:hypothetical protein [Arthrobacter sp. KNU40]|uniref:hypothetical protein n=1 Tax=Arthrobacter sp. KNU40 TaxID=3447965 RepID=UPI003F639CF0
MSKRTSLDAFNYENSALAKAMKQMQGPPMMDTSWITRSVLGASAIQKAHDDAMRIFNMSKLPSSWDTVMNAAAVAGATDNAAESAVKSIERLGLNYESVMQSAGFTASKLMSAMDMPGISSYVQEIASTQNAFGAITMPYVDVLRSSIVEQVMASTDALREEFRGTQVQELANDLLENKDIAQAVERSIAFLDLSDAQTKATIAWFIGIVVGLMVLALMLELKEASGQFAELLSLMGFDAPGAEGLAAGTYAGKKTKDGLDRRFPSEK